MYKVKQNDISKIEIIHSETNFNLMSIKKVLFDYEGLGKEIHNQFIGKNNTELGKHLGISNVQAAKLRNGLEVGKETLFIVKKKLGISLDKFVIQ